MLDMDLPRLNVTKTHALMARLEAISNDGPEATGRLSADLGDLYAGAVQYQRLVDSILNANEADREHFGQLISDLYEEMRHLYAHLESSLDGVDALAERFD